MLLFCVFKFCRIILILLCIPFLVPCAFDASITWSPKLHTRLVLGCFFLLFNIFYFFYLFFIFANLILVLFFRSIHTLVEV